MIDFITNIISESFLAFLDYVTSLLFQILSLILSWIPSSPDFLTTLVSEYRDLLDVLLGFNWLIPVQEVLEVFVFFLDFLIIGIVLLFLLFTLRIVLLVVGIIRGSS